MMEKKKRHRNSISDDLSIVKAAAWAWYQHGSGSEGKPMREFDATLTTPLRPPNKPSRYKMEAIKLIIQQQQKPSLDIQQFYSSSSITSTPTHDHHHEYSKNHSLLDAYEVEKISKQLDQLILSNSNRFNGFDDNSNKDLDSPKSSEIVKKNNNKKRSLLKGIWSRHSVVCGTRDDVVSRALVRTRPLPTTTVGRARGDGLLVPRNHI